MENISVRKAIESRYEKHGTVYLAYCYEKTIEPDKKNELYKKKVNKKYVAWLYQRLEEYTNRKEKKRFVDWIWSEVLARGKKQ